MPSHLALLHSAPGSPRHTKAFWMAKPSKPSSIFKNGPSLSSNTENTSVWRTLKNHSILSLSGRCCHHTVTARKNECLSQSCPLQHGNMQSCKRNTSLLLGAIRCVLLAVLGHLTKTTVPRRIKFLLQNESLSMATT